LFGYEKIIAKGQRHGKDWCGAVLRPTVQRVGGVDDLRVVETCGGIGRKELARTVCELLDFARKEVGRER
jgi:hypothetical protein